MQSPRLARRVAGVAAAVVIIATGGLTAACGGKGNETPSTTPTTSPSSSAPSVSPSQNAPNPTGGNSFSPPPIAPPPATTHREREYPY
jgi:hypothetical protein